MWLESALKKRAVREAGSVGQLTFELRGQGWKGAARMEDEHSQGPQGGTSSPVSWES